MKRYVVLLTLLSSSVSLAHSQLKAEFAKLCYNEAAAQASIALSIGADHESDLDAEKMKQRKAKIDEETSRLLIVETACAEHTSSADEKDACIRENYEPAAFALLNEFQLDDLKAHPTCTPTVEARDPSADTIVCSFTEPFFTITIEPNGKMVRTEPDWEGDLSPKDTVITTNARVELKRIEVLSPVAHTPIYSVRDGKNELMVLDLNYQGGDGMSNTIYPYDAMIRVGASNESTMYGGCSSKRLKAFEVIEASHE